MQGVFDIVNVAGVKEDGDAIFLLLKDIFTGKLKNDLKLLNYYEEMPISYGNPTIDNCTGGALELTVHPNQSVVIELQKQSILKSSHFPSALSVHTKVEYANSKKNYVVLGRFAYAQVRAERRAAVRVRMQDQTSVGIKSTTGVSCAARLVDISVSGVKLLDAQVCSSDLAECTLVLVLLGERVTLPATFLRETTNERGHFLVFTIQPDSRTEVLISKLIYNRQVEIIQTIKDQIM